MCSNFVSLHANISDHHFALIQGTLRLPLHPDRGVFSRVARNYPKRHLDTRQMNRAALFPDILVSPVLHPNLMLSAAQRPSAAYHAHVAAGSDRPTYPADLPPTI